MGESAASTGRSDSARVRDHAVLSPSASSRWLKCTPSARFEQQFPSTTTVFAEEGTLAHAISENILKYRLNIAPPSEYNVWMGVFEKNSLYTLEMLTYCEQYADFCMATVHPDSLVDVEAKLDITDYVPEGFGTGDFMSYTRSLKLLEFTDLKYGKGVPVSATDNPQLKIYALGAYAWYRWVYGDDVDIDTIKVNIYQPRLNNISSWEVATADLLLWAETVLKPQAEKAFAGEGEFVVGDHCKFCRARVRCEALAEHNLDMFRHELVAREKLSDEALADIVLRVPLLVDWATDIKDYVTGEMVAGKSFKGLKLVEGKSNRVFVSESDTEKKLLDAMVAEDKIYTPKKLLGVTALEKNLGAKVFKELVAPDLRKPAGKPTLVSADDPRRAYDSAETVFRDAELREQLTEE